MSRAIRRVPKGWEHPTDCKGFYIPLTDKTVWQALWDHIRYDLWGYLKQPQHLGEWFKESPLNWRDTYRPRHTAPATCYQVYEEVSEGTPTSPVFATETDMRQWLLEQGHNRDAVDQFIKGGWAPSMIGVWMNGQMHWSPSGIDSLTWEPAIEKEIVDG